MVERDLGLSTMNLDLLEGGRVISKFVLGPKVLTCQEHVESMPKTSQEHGKNLLKTCLEFATNMPRNCQCC